MKIRTNTSGETGNRTPKYGSAQDILSKLIRFQTARVQPFVHYLSQKSV